MELNTEITVQGEVSDTSHDQMIYSAQRFEEISTES